MATDGSIYAFERSGIPSIERLRSLARSFPHSVWLNPIGQSSWNYACTVKAITTIFPMFALSLDGLEKAVRSLLQR